MLGRCGWGELLVRAISQVQAREESPQGIRIPSSQRRREPATLPAGQGPLFSQRSKRGIKVCHSGSQGPGTIPQAREPLSDRMCTFDMRVIATKALHENA